MEVRHIVVRMQTLFSIFKTLSILLKLPWSRLFNENLLLAPHICFPQVIFDLVCMEATALFWHTYSVSLCNIAWNDVITITTTGWEPTQLMIGKFTILLLFVTGLHKSMRTQSIDCKSSPCSGEHTASVTGRTESFGQSH